MMSKVRLPYALIIYECHFPGLDTLAQAARFEDIAKFWNTLKKKIQRDFSYPLFAIDALHYAIRKFWKVQRK